MFNTQRDTKVHSLVLFGCGMQLMVPSSLGTWGKCQLDDMQTSCVLLSPFQGGMTSVCGGHVNPRMQITAGFMAYICLDCLQNRWLVREETGTLCTAEVPAEAIKCPEPGVKLRSQKGRVSCSFRFQFLMFQSNLGCDEATYPPRAEESGPEEEFICTSAME